MKTNPVTGDRRLELGDVARDTITGFEGVVIAETKWLHGCRRLMLQPRALHEGKPIDAVSFDEPQLAYVEIACVDGVPVEGTADTGGPRPEPRRGR
jgi:hypothetical protein